MHLLVLASFFRFAYVEASLSFGFLLRYCRPAFRQRLLQLLPLMRWGTESQKVWPIKLARLIMFSVNYSHFTTEHNHNHHKWVATEHDPASALKEEGLWLFWARAIPGQFVSSVRVNTRKGRTGLRNPSYQWLATQFAALLCLFSLPRGDIMMIGWLGLSGIAILTLEYVNYIRHWGLRRGRDERQTEMHSGIPKQDGPGGLCLVNSSLGSPPTGEHTFLAASPSSDST